MLMAKLKPTKLKADFYKRYIFNMGLAVARGLVHCFFYTLVDLKEEPNLDNHDVADTWEEQTFGGLLLSEEDLEKGPIWRPVERPRLDYPLSLGKPGERRRWIVLPGNLMASIPRSRFIKRQSVKMVETLTWLAKSSSCLSRPSITCLVPLPIAMEVVLAGRAAMVMLRAPQLVLLVAVLSDRRPPTSKTRRPTPQS